MSTLEGLRGRPALFQLAADPLRWRLLHELGSGDRRVGELCDIVGRPQSAISYHLRALRDAGLARARRSSADGRDTYYSLDLPQCAAMFDDAAAALHPGLARRGSPETGLSPTRGDGQDRPPRVLFLCTGNSARSQIAEAIYGKAAGDAALTRSAGSRPKPVHPFTAVVLAEHGIEAPALRSKPLEDFTGEHFDVVVTLCDKVREVCPDFPGAARVHWSLPDPSAAGNHDECAAAFRAVAAEIETRIRYFLAAHTARGTTP